MLVIRYNSNFTRANMANNLKNKIVVVTGGAVGIGYGIADIFLQNEAKVVVLLDIDETLGAEASNTLSKKHGGPKAPFIKCDVTTDREEVAAKIIKTYGHVDVLVNNAGILDERMSKRTLDVNLLAVIDWSFMFCEHMRIDKNGKGGTIINISSIYGYRAQEFTPIYNATKFAMMGFTRSLGHVNNYKRTGVKVVALCPGFTHTSATKTPITSIWDKEILDDFRSYVSKLPRQDIDSVGKAALEVFEKADTGTLWLIEGAQPITEV